MTICARCRCDLTNAKEDGISSLYSGQTFILCAPCFEEEDRLIEAHGTNDLPEEVAKYRQSLKEMLRPC